MVKLGPVLNNKTEPVFHPLTKIVLTVAVLFELLRIWAAMWEHAYHGPWGQAIIAAHLADPEKPDQLQAFFAVSLVWTIIYLAIIAIPLVLLAFKRKWALYFFPLIFVGTFLFFPNSRAALFPFNMGVTAFVFSIAAISFSRESARKVSLSSLQIIDEVQSRFDPNRKNES